MCRGNVCLILFHGPDFGLDDAFRLLSACSALSVTRTADALAVQRPGGPLLTVRFQCGPATQQWVARLGVGTPYAKPLNGCDACFWINMKDLRAVLADKNSLVRVQRILLEATHGFQYTLWNDRFASAAELTDEVLA
jgi:hypothetical protein